MTIGKQEAISVEPVWLMGRVLHGVLPECDADGCHAYCGTGVAHAELLAEVGDEDAEGLDDEGHFIFGGLGWGGGFMGFF